MRHKRFSFELFLVMIVFSIFAVGALFLCGVGANTYRDTTAVMQQNYDFRTGVMYLTEKTRQSDVAGAISVRKINGVDALVLTEQQSGKGYETWIFVYNNNLCEQLIASGADVILPLAQPIMPMESMNLSIDRSGQLTIELKTPDGLLSAMTLALKSQGPAFNFNPAAATSGASASARTSVIQGETAGGGA